LLVTDEKHCVLCGSPFVEVHHCFEGTGRRKISDKYDLTVYLCRLHHNAVHAKPNQGWDLELKQMAQKYFEEHYGTREDFIKAFIKSYL